MKNKCIIITIILLTAFTINTAAEENTTNIVCTNSALADFTSNLIEGNVTIEYIMPSGVCPAYYDATPSDVSKIITADVIISFGSQSMEPWLGDLLEYNQNYSLIECKDMGEWNIPSGAIAYVKHITTELCEILPDLNDTITNNYDSYLEQINETAFSLKELIENKGYVNLNIVTMQWQEDFLEWLGLNISYAYGPPQGLSAQDEIDIINAASENNVYVIVDNLQSGTSFGAKIASETGASHVIFTNFPNAVPGTDTYLDMITYNTQQLIDGIETYDYKQGDISNLEKQIGELELQRNISLIFVIIFIIIALALFAMYKRK